METILTLKDIQDNFDIELSFVTYYGIVRPIRKYFSSLKMVQPDTFSLLDDTNVMRKLLAIKSGCKQYYYILTNEQNEKAKSTVAQSKVHKQKHFQMEESDDNLVGKLEINRIGQADRCDVIWLTPKVDGHFLSMELDTGSAISLVCKSKYDK